MPKKYPFSIEKNDHELMYLQNYSANRGKDLDERYEKAIEEYHAGKNGRISWVSGPTLGVLREAVHVAQEIRVHEMTKDRMAKRGHK